MIRSVILILWIIPSGLLAQKVAKVGGMALSYEWDGEDPIITLKAPTTGWLGFGLNSRNSIVGSDLMLFRVVGGKSEGIDMYVVGAGNPKEDESLGGKTSFEIIDAKESGGSSEVSVRLLWSGDEKLDFRPELGEEFWLIMAYSTHDDFGHHSRMRQHIPFSFSK